jgi:hypothetical protein
VAPPRAGRGGRAALGVAALGLAAAATELARWDHGAPDAFFAVAFVVAPVVLIFGAAAAGARRWYGWPDLGPLPGRAACLAGAVVAGVLLGVRVGESDVAETQARGARLAREIRAWRDVHGRWPSRLEEAVEDPPRTRLGALAPPPFRWDAAETTLSFPLARGAALVLDVRDDRATWRRR